MTRRNYSSTAQRTTLSAGCTNVATTLTVTAVTGWPASTPYIIIVDPDTVNEEIMLVTNRSGLTLTVTRAQGGTTGVAHSSGAVVQHGVYAQDFEDPNAFLNNAAAAPGPVQFSAGTAALPAITTSGDPNTGIYFAAADQVNVAAGGALSASFTGTGFTSQGNITTNGGVFISATGSAGTAALSPVGDANTGIYFPSADAVGITTNGSQKFQINSTGTISGAGTSLGAWGAYTPTITGWAVGNGTLAAVSMVIGKTCHYRIVFTAGTTTTYGGNCIFSLAYNALATVFASNSTAFLFDASASTYYEATARISSQTTVEVGPTGGALGIMNTTFSSTSPFTWASGDKVIVAGTYETV